MGNNLCRAGYEIPDGARCAHCGADENQECMASSVAPRIDRLKAQRDELLALLEAIAAERHQCFIPTDRPGVLYDWDERAATAIAKAHSNDT